MFSLYHDEDALQMAVVGELRRAGFDCLTVAEAGMRRQPDDIQLEFAAGLGRVLFTHNIADFRRLDAAWHRAGLTHAGIIVLSDQRTPIGVQVRCFEALASLRTAEEMEGRLEFLLNYA